MAPAQESAQGVRGERQDTGDGVALFAGTEVTAVRHYTAHHAVRKMHACPERPACPMLGPFIIFMTVAVYSVLAISSVVGRGDAFISSLEAAGCHVLGHAECHMLVREATRLSPEMVVCDMPVGDDALFAALEALRVEAPRPVMVFTEDETEAVLRRAVDAGVHGLVIGRRADVRLAAELKTAHARFLREQASRALLADALARLDERKWVERAKGVLMAARQISEDDAFRLLRGASMHTNLRVGDVSRSVIASAELADAVNRAGQLRMLSQRIIKLLAQQAAGVEVRRTKTLLEESRERVTANLERLHALKLVQPASDELAAVASAWRGLQGWLGTAPKPAMLQAADAQAETLLEHAEALTGAIEAAGGRQAVHIVNVSGRQRMRVQRLAKDALLHALLDDRMAKVRVEATMAEFAQALDELERAPLTSADIRDALARARDEWLRMQQGLRDARSAEARQALARGSEALLALFEQLTAAYEHSLHVIMGG
jgi:AmiR/NasT family two-component response regulator